MRDRLRIMGIYLLTSLSLLANAQVQVKNNAPIVEIIKPDANETFKWNTLIPYAINVNDEEDGNSVYEEIADREVILIVKFLKDSSMVTDYLESIDIYLGPLINMSKSTCLNCHAAKNRLIGPSFDLIAKMYSSKVQAKTYLTEKVISGGMGTWGEEKMPPHPDLNKQEAGILINWILKQKDNPTQFYVGLEGSIRLQGARVNANKEVCVLTAVYEDHGLTDSTGYQKQGLQTITFRVSQ